MFGWLFGRNKKRPKKRKSRSLRSYDELAAEFFAMWPQDQVCVLRALGVAKPESTLDYAQPCLKVESMADFKRQNDVPMLPGSFLAELREQLDEGRRIQVIAVFQQIFGDLKECENFVDALEENDQLS